MVIKMVDQTPKTWTETEERMRLAPTRTETEDQRVLVPIPVSAPVKDTAVTALHPDVIKSNKNKRKNNT